jgi:hypothetical protein
VDGVKDHIIPHLSGKKTTKDMWEALVKLYQSDNQSRKMLLREKLRSTKMAKGESVVTYLTKFTQIRDELAAVGEKVDETELVRTTLNGFTKQWEVFVRGVVAREKLPDWERLWDDFTQEELRVDASQASQPKSEEEENVALHAKKSSGAGGSRDMSKVRCFACHKTDHYANKCPTRKKKESEVAATTSTEMDAFAEKFDDEFSLVATLSSSNRLAEFEDSGAWFVDSGSSRHMTGMRSVFLSVSETGLDCHVKNGARTRHAVKGVGCVRFQLESGVSLEVDEVMYVPELKVNLLSISTLEDMGYEVMFADGHVLIRAEGAALDATVRLGIRQGMMYRVLGQPVGGSRGILDQRSVSKKVSWYDLTLMDEQSNTSDQSATEVAGGSSGSEGAATTTTTDLIGSEIDPGGDTSLAKREC